MNNKSASAELLINFRTICLCLSVIIFIVLTGCAMTNFATSPTPVDISNEWIRESPHYWKGTYIYQVDNLELIGVAWQGNGATFTIDPGEKLIRVFHLENKGDYSGLYWQTDLADMKAHLKPNGKYQVRSDCGETICRFKLIDIETNTAVTESVDMPIIRRPLGTSNIRNK